MPWQTKVPLWVLRLVGDYIIPEDTAFVTNSKFQKLDSAIDAVVSDQPTYTHRYPGLVPDVRVSVDTIPTVGGLEISLEFVKGIGFYGVVSSILSYDAKRLNAWTFPLDRKNFGYIALSRGDRVSLNQPVHYKEQFHIDAGVSVVASNYDVERARGDLLNDIDEFALTEVHGFQYPGVRTQISFLPILEVWAVKFFQANT